MHHPGRTLRRLRLLQRMKQSHLAERLDVNQATVSRWECGLLPMSWDQQAAAWRLLVVRPAPSQDAALRRLVESSARKVHLVCDRTHRLLAASPTRQAEWHTDPAQLLGQSLIGYASPEILTAEATLDSLGWHDGHLSCLTVETGANADPQVPIAPGRALWERIMLADGSAGRLVTTLA
ncbi:helix-turn-helix transcriptional regulator [Bradyrhizobium prioriisuperbiae]|uniref:helix-turn-helix domain-containing protein n=1 Tax=Bradyrhizobium prioriisuperbiae TaxID=2854389 RepID=UPI0028EC6916|nr:helix-turn-helix transcriptional regulator [Bradyrhizobium prioritasuperba]